MGTFKNLPLYQAEINDESEGMYCISLVDFPATESNFLAFAEAKQLLKYSVEDEDKHLVFGLVMAANLPIYRYDDVRGEYFITYSKETIAQMAQKYLADGYQNNCDTMHNFEMEDGIEMRQIFIKDTERGVNPTGFEAYEDGSLFAEFHIDNQDVWDSIKNGEFKGFSLAGAFEVVPTEDNNKSKKDNSIMSKLLNAFAKLLVKFGQITTDKAVLVWTGDEDLKAGDEVFVENENGEMVAPEDGDYTTEDEKVITVKEGKVEAIVDPKADVDEEDEKPAEEPAPAEDAEFAAFKAEVQKFEESYDEKIQKIAAAVIAEGEDAYLIEAGDEYAVKAVWTEDGIHYFKYAISWDEEGNVIVGENEEVKEAFIPVETEEPATEEETPVEEQMAEEEKPAEEEKTEEEEPAEDKDARIAELEAEIAEKDTKIAELEAEIEKLKEEPAEPIAEEFKKATQSKGSSKLDKMCDAIAKSRELFK